MIEFAPLASVGNFLLNLLKLVQWPKGKNAKTKIIISPTRSKRDKIKDNSRDLIILVRPNFFAMPLDLRKKFNVNHDDSALDNIAIYCNCLSVIRINNKSNKVINNLILNFKNMTVYLAQAMNDGVAEDLLIERNSTIQISTVHIEEDRNIFVWHTMYKKLDDLAISHSGGRVSEVVFTHEPSMSYIK